MRDFPLVSVVMAVHNEDDYLIESLNSILGQTYPHIEIIIVDDCSTNGKTALIISDFARINNKIVVLRNSQNLGLAKSLNSALRVANGIYICRADADDYYDLNRIYEQVNFMEENRHIDIVGTCSIVIDKNGRGIGNRDMPSTDTQIKHMMLYACSMNHPSILFRRSVFSKIGFYNEAYRVSQDYELWFRAMSKGVIFANLTKRLHYYRITNTLIKRRKFKNALAEIKIRYKGYRKNNVALKTYLFLLIPLANYIMPEFIYKMIRRRDPRGKA